MPYYRCLVNGSGFPGEMVETEGKVGFYASRALQALNERQAKARMMKRLRREPELQPPPRPRKRWFQRKPPKGPDMSGASIRFVRVERIDRLPLARERGKGAFWYKE